MIKYLNLLLMLMLLPLSMVAQEMSVESFKKLESDMSARITFPEKDPSGRTCAIIKVVNPNTGFVFDTGTVSVVKSKQETGEIWVYVQPGVKKLTVSHPTLGVMRDYFFPMPIEEATVYELRLTTGTVHTYVEQRSSISYLVINSTPEGAEVYIGDEWVGTTPFQKKYNQGERLQYRASRALYHDEVGEVVLNKTKNEITAQLKPAYGSVAVTSQPSGASVILDNETGSRGKTPITIGEVASGQHRLRVQLPRYGQQVFDVTIEDGKTSNVDAKLTASFAQITVNTLPGATVKVDGATKGTGTTTWEQDAGLCEIEVSQDGHRTQSKQIEVTPGQPQTITLEPIPMYGVLAVESDPMGADVYIDGQKRGVTPEVFEHILATNHAIKLSKAGYVDYSTTFTVKEGQEQIVEAKLSVQEKVSTSKEQPVTITTPQTSADGSINGHGYVDLGLPSGLKWATYNVGASKPEGYGSYFAWGETSTKPSFTEKNSETYKKKKKWLNNNGYIDSNGNLTLAHDAARQNWGATWRMPTKEEIVELYNNTTSEWTTRNGVYGFLVKGKRNGKSIFLPAAGCRYGSSLNNDGSNGYYWSSTPYESAILHHLT